MITVYAKACNVSARSKITLLLDGEPIDENTTAKDQDLEDGDIVDVQVQDM